MQMIIGGAHVNARDNERIDVVNPATLERIDTIPNAALGDVEEAVNIANRGKVIWKNTPMHERVRILQRFTALLEENIETLSKIMCDEIGKPIGSCIGEVKSTITVFNGYCAKALNLFGETLPVDSEPFCTGDVVFTVREPLGVVVCIVPFNYPASLYAHKVAPALVSGNAVIVKPSSHGPLNNIFLTELLHQAGVPGEVLQIITGRASKIGDYLSSHKNIDAVSLTGSTEVGIQTAWNGVKNLTKVYLELGGNDPLIIFDDGELERAVRETVNGRIPNAGQTCCAAKRILVQNGIKERFTERLAEMLKEIKVGDPRDPQVACGPLISEDAAVRVEEMVQKTMEQGAKCLLGGRRFHRTFFPPTILTEVTPAMDIAGNMEIFGPVFPIIGFDTIDEAVEIANQTSYGLSSGVMTNSMSTAFQVARRIEAGTCVINGSGDYRTASQAFGGYKMSGRGREGYGYTLDEFTQIKSIVLRQLG